jgi:Pilus formation protein N terminal region
MFGSLRRVAFVPGFFVLFCAAAILAACGGSFTPPSGPSSTASNIVGLNGAAGSAQTVSLPSPDGYGGSMILTFAQSASNVSADISVGPSPPAGAPLPTGTDQPLVFVGLSLSSNVTLLGSPAFALAIPESALQSIRRAQNADDFELLLDFFDPNNPSAGYQPFGACSLNGNTAMCSGSNALLDLLASLQYVFECTRHNRVPTPSPSPSSSPAGGTTVIVVPTPAAIVCNPPSVVVAVNGTAIIDCTAQDYGGKFTVAVANPAIASVQQSDSLTFTYFTITGLSAGTTTLTLQSQPGGTGSVPITVDQ